MISSFNRGDLDWIFRKNSSVKELLDIGPGQMVESLFLGVFKNSVDVALGDMV